MYKYVIHVLLLCNYVIELGCLTGEHYACRPCYYYVPLFRIEVSGEI